MPKMYLQVSKLKGLASELQCTQCGKLLSVLPVYYCAATGNVCGRCAPSLSWMISNGTLERSVAYEAVAKHILFPCANSAAGCAAELKWNEVEAHEKSCSASVFPCPLNVQTDDKLLQCPWQGRMPELVPHLHSSHVEYRQTNLVSFVIDLRKDNTRIFITTISEHTFLVFAKFIEPTQKLYCVAMCCAPKPENQYYRYQLQLGKDDGYFLILRKNNSIEYDELNKIIEHNCNVILVDLPSVIKILGNPDSVIHCKVGIVKKAKKEITEVMENLKITETTSSPSAVTKAAETPVTVQKPRILKKLSEMDKQLLEELQCPICTNYMVPPIYICVTGHSLCLDCKNKLSECPTCQTRLENTRNYTLEKLTNHVQYPCSYSIAGCTEICNSQLIRKHEDVCFYRKKSCPLRMLPSLCNVQHITGDLVDHILETHKAHLIETNSTYARNLKAKVSTTYYLTVHEREIFFVCCKHSPALGPIKFNVVHFGTREGHPRYRYELQFLDQVGTGLKLIISQLCQPVPPHLNLALKNCLTIPLELMEPFIAKTNEPMLHFRFCLEKF